MISNSYRVVAIATTIAALAFEAHSASTVYVVANLSGPGYGGPSGSATLDLIGTASGTPGQYNVIGGGGEISGRLVTWNPAATFGGADNVLYSTPSSRFDYNGVGFSDQAGVQYNLYHWTFSPFIDSDFLYSSDNSVGFRATHDSITQYSIGGAGPLIAVDWALNDSFGNSAYINLLATSVGAGAYKVISGSGAINGDIVTYSARAQSLWPDDLFFNTGNSDHVDLNGIDFIDSSGSQYNLYQGTGVTIAKNGGVEIWRYNAAQTLNIFPLETPEPSSWAVMMIGLGSAGISLRRRRARAA